MVAWENTKGSGGMVVYNGGKAAVSGWPLGVGWAGSHRLKRPCLPWKRGGLKSLACPGGKMARARSCLPWSSAEALEN